MSNNPLYVARGSALTLTLLSALLFMPGKALCAASEPQPLYAIEMIVFERLHPGGNSEDEAWPKNLTLSYPFDWKILRDPDAPEPAISELGANDRASWALSDDVLQQIGGNESQAVARDAESEPLSAASEPSPQAAETTEARDRPAPYEYLPEDTLALTNERLQLNRDRNLRVLFHNRWQQPLQAENTAPALILRGGSQYGSHHELEGFISVYLGRYIHVDTDLWLTQFVANHGQSSDHWPQLPGLPDKNEALYQRLSDSLGGLSPTDEDYNFSELQSGQSTSGLTISEQDSEGSIYSRAQTDWTDNLAPPTTNQFGVQSPYLIDQIVTMRQSRRMRSNELHYFDHPRMGVLVVVTAVDQQNDEEPGTKDPLAEQE